MKLKYIIFAFALSMAACKSDGAHVSSSQEAVIKAEIEAVFEDLVSATKERDHELYFSFFDTSTLTILNANGSTLQSFDAFKLIYEPQLGAVQRYNSLEFDPVHISVVDAKSAILVNEYYAEVVLTSGDVVSAAGAGAQFWSKRSGEWKLVHISDAQKQ